MSNILSLSLLFRYYLRFASVGLDDTLIISIYMRFAIIIVTNLFPFMVLMRSLVLFGYTANAIPDVCIDLIIAMPPAVKGQEASHRAQDAMRLYSIVEKRPCQLLLLGYEVQAGDGLKLFLFVVFLQIASSVGLGWLLT